MARPSKADVAKREKIKELGLFVRDGKQYQYFESTSFNLSSHEIPYIFALECMYRIIDIDEVINILNSDNPEHLERKKAIAIIFNQYLAAYKINTEKIDKLRQIDLRAFIYLVKTLEGLEQGYHSSIGHYNVYNLILQNDLNKIYNEERLKSLGTGNDGDWYLLEDLIPFNEKEYIERIGYEDKNLINFLKQSKRRLSNKEFEEFREYYRKNPFTDYAYKTIISKHTNRLLEERSSAKIFYVELDFTKPKEELIEFVSKIKDDFNQNPNSIQTPNVLFGNEEKIFQCDVKASDIYKTNNIKPIEGRLSDILFIYDCKKVGLDNDYIIDEINRYWIDIKNLYKDKFRASTLTEYHNLAKDYIDNQKYECYLSGYDFNS